MPQDCPERGDQDDRDHGMADEDQRHYLPPAQFLLRFPTDAVACCRRLQACLVPGEQALGFPQNLRPDRSSAAEVPLLQVSGAWALLGSVSVRSLRT